MAGIGNTIETDLVGEYVEVREQMYEESNGWILTGRGRVRAATFGADSYLCLWIEVTNEHDELTFCRGSTPVEIGDVVRTTIHERTRIRLIKQP